MLFRYLAGVMLLCGTAYAAADEVDMTLSDNSALFRYINHFDGSYGHSELDAGFLYTNDNDFLAMLGFQVDGEAGTGSPGLHVGVGVKGFSANTDKADILAVALGGELHYMPLSLERLGFRGSIYHAPNIVSFLDVERFTYIALSVEYTVLQQATVYLGFRNAEYDYKGQSNVVLDEDTHLGLRIEF